MDGAVAGGETAAARVQPAITIIAMHE